jgi:hypothetical protein
MFVAEVVEEEEGVKIFRFAEAEGPLEADPCAFKRGFCRQDLFHRSKGHGVVPFLVCWGV